MGWTFSKGATRRDIIAEILRDYDNRSARWSVVESHSSPSGLWVALANTNDETTLIAFYALEAERNYGWGYKSMDETMGPNYYDVPLTWLDKYAYYAKTEFSLVWRERVREYHAKRRQTARAAAKWRAGDLLQLPERVGAKLYRVVSTRPFRAVGEADGVRYRIARQLLAEANRCN